MDPVLEITDLTTHIHLAGRVVQAVGNVGLRIEPGQTLGLVGESGCGKSMTALSIMGLLPPGGRIAGGSIRLEGRELTGLPDAALRQIRGNEITMISQDPLTSLDPTETIGYQVAEPVRLHCGAGRNLSSGPSGAGIGRRATSRCRTTLRPRRAVSRGRSEPTMLPLES